MLLPPPASRADRKQQIVGLLDLKMRICSLYSQKHVVYYHIGHLLLSN